MTDVFSRIDELWAITAVRAAAIIVGAFVAAKIVDIVLRRTLGAVARRTKTTLDDTIVNAIRRPISYTVILIALGYVLGTLALAPEFRTVVVSALETLCVLVWASAAFRIGLAVLVDAEPCGSAATSIVQPRTMPVFDMLRQDHGGRRRDLLPVPGLAHRPDRVARLGRHHRHRDRLRRQGHARQPVRRHLHRRRRALQGRRLHRARRRPARAGHPDRHPLDAHPDPRRRRDHRAQRA